MDDMRKYINLIESAQTLQEEQWISHRDLANVIFKHTKNRQLALDFIHLEDDYVSQDDMQSTNMDAMGFDPFQEDREQVNNILNINNVPVKVLKMKHNDAYESQYSILQSIK